MRPGYDLPPVARIGVDLTGGENPGAVHRPDRELTVLMVPPDVGPAAAVEVFVDAPAF